MSRRCTLPIILGSVTENDHKNIIREINGVEDIEIIYLNGCIYVSYTLPFNSDEYNSAVEEFLVNLYTLKKLEKDNYGK